MNIQLSPTDERSLAALAAQAGYQSAERYATEFLQEFVQQHATVGLEPLSESELQASLKMCDQGMKEAEAGRGVNPDQALNRIAAKYNLDVSE